MGKHGVSHHYSVKKLEASDVIRAKASNVAVKFKNLTETANVVRHMTLVRANAYLKNVINHKECVPFRKFKSGIGRCPQAKQFKTINGRWPNNAAKCILDLLKNAAANCEFYDKDPTDFLIDHIQVSEATKTTRRTYRAHGRINPYMKNPSHIQVILKEIST